MNKAHTVSKDSTKSDKGSSKNDDYDHEFNHVSMDLQLDSFKNLQKSQKVLQKLNGYAVSTVLDRKLIQGIFGQLGTGAPSGNNL